MSSTCLGVFSIVHQNGNEILIFPIHYIGRTSQSLKGHASIELKLLINLLYTKLYIYIYEPHKFYRRTSFTQTHPVHENSAVIL